MASQATRPRQETPFRGLGSMPPPSGVVRAWLGVHHAGRGFSSAVARNESACSPFRGGHRDKVPPSPASEGREQNLGSQGAHPLILSSCRRSCATLSCSADRSRSERLNFIGAKAALYSFKMLCTSSWSDSSSSSAIRTRRRRCGMQTSRGALGT